MGAGVHIRNAIGIYPHDHHADPYHYVHLQSLDAVDGRMVTQRPYN